MEYFSERELGLAPRLIEVIPQIAWDGIRISIENRVKDGSFGMKYPALCYNNEHVVIGADGNSFWAAMRAEIPRLATDLDSSPWTGGWEWTALPSTMNILDMIEFSWKSVGEPLKGSFHSYFGHYHLEFDAEIGRKKFAEDIERILRRNSIQYCLTDEGMIERIGWPILHEQVQVTLFGSGDHDLDQMLEKARSKFFSREEGSRQEAIEALWDAWERLKTTFEGKDKSEQATRMIDEAAGTESPKFKDYLSSEAKSLTEIGNNLLIRHSEVHKEKVVKNQHIDYLFYRLFSFISLVLKAKRRQ